MRNANLTSMLIENQRFQKQTTKPGVPHGSLPPKGHINPFEDPDLNITGKDPSQWQKTIPIDDAVAEKLKNLIKEDFVRRNGMCGTGKQADAQANIIKDYIKGLPGDQKLSAIYSCEQIAFKEAERLSSKIREQNPSWQYGQKFDTSILNNDFDLRI